jgi:phosphatidylglycerophosphate synthase
MFERWPAIGRFSDAIVKAPMRFLHLKLGATPAQVSWSSFVVSVIAGVTIGMGRLGWGLGFMAVGQILDGMDGGIAREFNLVSESGKKLDEALDRASETVIFLGFAVAGIVPTGLVLLALVAIGLLTTVSHRAKFDPGMKRFALYFGVLGVVSYSLIFKVIFAVNLAGYVIDLLIIDCQFQREMDTLGGDLDTVASRAIALEHK